MQYIFMVIIIFIILIAGIVALQIFLSGRQNKWLGLILPAISLLVSSVLTIVLTGIYFACREQLKKE